MRNAIHPGECDGSRSTDYPARRPMQCAIYSVYAIPWGFILTNSASVQPLSRSFGSSVNLSPKELEVVELKAIYLDLLFIQPIGQMSS